MRSFNWFSWRCFSLAQIWYRANHSYVNLFSFFSFFFSFFFNYIFFVLPSLRLYCFLILLLLFLAFSSSLVSISFYIFLDFFFYYCLLFSSILLIYFALLLYYLLICFSCSFYKFLLSLPILFLSHHSNWISCFLCYISRHVL